MARIVVIDTETTGLSPTDGHRLIEVAAVEIINEVYLGKLLPFLYQSSRP